MELGHLIDSNAVIDYLGKKLPLAGLLYMDNIIPAISVITRIEILSWSQIHANQLAALSQFISNSTIYSLDESVVVKTIELRQEYRIKTPDAIIAATAIINNQILITRNAKDFGKVSDLKVINPYAF